MWFHLGPFSSFRFPALSLKCFHASPCTFSVRVGPWLIFFQLESFLSGLPPGRRPYGPEAAISACPMKSLLHLFHRGGN